MHKNKITREESASPYSDITMPKQKGSKNST